jgi:cell division protein FtsL
MTETIMFQDSNLNIRNQNNKMIVPKEMKLKNIQKVIDKAITPKCQLKWEISYEKIFYFSLITSIILVSKMILNMCFNSSKTCLI